MRAVAALLIGLLLATPALAQTPTKRPPARRPAPAAPAPPKTEPAMINCPSMLGEGQKTRRMFCDVLTGRDPAGGIIITLPPHAGPVTLSFDLHNRHTYSEELIKTKQAYRRYTATIGVLTADNTLLTRAAIQNEFRGPADLVDRVLGGGGPGGLKAVAPTGTESIIVEIPQDEQSVSILGEKLSVIRPDASVPDNFAAPGRPIAVISNVMVQYRPPPPPRPQRRTTPTRRTP